ncbi:MAG: hypothetical protein HY007_01920 [Candidatus Sungbacteria bacterium]|nr:hypothetical protein [Candidatus Sungbacteria bacterium]
MKDTIIVGVVLFVVGGLVGFGADRVYMRRKLAASEQQMSQQIGENNQGVAGAGVGAGGQETGAARSNEAPSATVGPSLDGQISMSIGKNSVSVEDQKPGDTVVIQSVTLAATGWVVVHDDNGGKPGHILGAHRFNAGTYTGQNVELLKGTEEGKVYYAMLHADDGDKQFDYRVDLSVKDETGNPVMMRFVATSKSAQ